MEYKFNEEDFTPEGIKKQESILEGILNSLQRNSQMNLEEKRAALALVGNYMIQYQKAGELYKKNLVKKNSNLS
jgi:hypothetical protein